MCGIARDRRHVLIACAGTCTCINNLGMTIFRPVSGVKFSGLFRCENFQAYLGVKNFRPI